MYFKAGTDTTEKCSLNMPKLLVKEYDNVWRTPEDCAKFINDSLKLFVFKETIKRRTKMTDDNTQKYPKIINLIGQPGAGKSTLAATVFANSKCWVLIANSSLNLQRIRHGNRTQPLFSNQIYVFAKQYYRMDRCSGKVDVLITDSPLIMSPMYNKDMDIDKPLKELVSAINGKYHNLYYYVKRVKKYNPIGRSQTEDESDEIGNETQTDAE